MSKDPITQARVKELFDYRDDGNLIWRKDHKMNNHHTNHFKKGQTVGAVHSDGIVLKVSIDKKQYLVKRLIWLWHKGNPIPHMVLQSDDDKRNNRIENLYAGKARQAIKAKSKPVIINDPMDLFIYRPANVR